MPDEYVHALGQMLEQTQDREERLQLARLLGATGSADAAPYLLEALEAEENESGREAIRHALSQLDGHHI